MSSPPPQLFQIHLLHSNFVSKSKNKTKTLQDQFVLTRNILGWWPSPRSQLTHQGLHSQRKWTLSFSTVYSCQLLHNKGCLALPSMLGFGLAVTYTGFVHVITDTVCSYVQLPCRIQETLFPVATLRDLSFISLPSPPSVTDCNP